MKGFKTIILFSLLVSFFQCKKESKEKPVEKVLENGLYVLYYQTSNGGQGWNLYLINENNFFGNYDRRLLCMDRVAGLVERNGDEIEIPYLHWQNSSSINPCNFYSDLYGGDTMVFHFSNIEMFLDNNLKYGLKGNIFYNNPSPFWKSNGNFTLTYTPQQTLK